MKERIQIKHDFEENWKKAVNFVPLAGEFIIYDGIIEDGEYIQPPRFKLGDGVTKVNDLPFIDFGAQKNQVKNATLVIN